LSASRSIPRLSFLKVRGSVPEPPEVLFWPGGGFWAWAGDAGKNTAAIKTQKNRRWVNFIYSLNINIGRNNKGIQWQWLRTGGFGGVTVPFSIRIKKFSSIPLKNNIILLYFY
jgi:hypothetical protein